MKKINIAEKSFNPFDLIGQKWMLISAGTEDKWNTMTASWGAVGVMWGKPSATCYIRKSRFTKEFVDAGEYFTLTVLKDGNRQALNTLGSKSGRDMDKMHESSLPSSVSVKQFGPNSSTSRHFIFGVKRAFTFIPPGNIFSFDKSGIGTSLRRNPWSVSTTQSIRFSLNSL